MNQGDFVVSVMNTTVFNIEVIIIKHVSPLSVFSETPRKISYLILEEGTMSFDFKSKYSNRMCHQLHPFSNLMSLETMSIESRAVMFKVTRIGWSNLGIGMAKFGPNWPQLELLASEL